MDRSKLAEDGGGTAQMVAGSYRCGPVVVDAAAQVLTRDGVVCSVEPKAFAVLLVLLRHAGELVTHEQLLDAVWGHRHVTPGVLTRAIAQLRAALGDDSHAPRYIQTRHALGYRFVGELEPPVGQTETPERERATDPITDPAVEPVMAFDAEPATTAPDRPVGARDRPAAATQAVLPRAADPLPTLPAAAGPRRTGLRRLHRVVAALALTLALSLTALVWSNREALPTHQPDTASIAVLPFTSLSSERDDGYFAEGLSVEMQSALSGVPGLKVAARSSAAAAAGRNGDVKAIGRLLGVATVLDANVRREGRRMRIDARLSDTGTGFILWSQSYDRDSGDVFAVQSEIANEVVRALQAVLPRDGDSALQRLGRRLMPTRDIDAYEAYLKGLQQLQVERGDTQLREAVGSFRQALAIDAGFARAQAGICRAEIKRFEYARDAPAYERAQAACLQASRMDPALREVSLALGEIHRVRGESVQAVTQYRRALEDVALRPAAYIGLARTMAALDRGDLALKYFERAQQLRPGDATAYREIGYYRYLQGDTDAAIEAFRKATLLLPQDADLWASLGGLYLNTGKIEPAAAALERSLAIDPGAGALSNFGTLRYEQRRYSAAAELYRRAAELDPGDFRFWGNLADALAATPATAKQAREPYRHAAQMAVDYVAVKHDDAQALALLAWYQANLGQTEIAVQRLRQAEALPGDSGDVAFFNAQTLALLGDADGARRRLTQARADGVTDRRIQASPVLRRLSVGAAEVRAG